MKTFLRAALFGLTALAGGVPAGADLGLGADLVSRYVWRGTDYGDAVSVQPSTSFSAGANEHDLYVTYAAQDLAVTVTDYFYPQGGDSFEVGQGLEAGVVAGLGNGAYTSDPDPALVNVGLAVAGRDYSASYILNPEAETTFLVLGYSF